MSRIIIFGGTKEGRETAISLAEAGHDILVFVTSEYGKSLLPSTLPCHVGILQKDDMLNMLASHHPDQVIDATHPYAVQATQNIHSCCQSLGILLRRIERPASLGFDSLSDACDLIERVPDAADAAKSIIRTSGPVLLTTGSKTLSTYTTQVPPERLWVRVLPTHEALSLCSDAGILPSHIIAMHGPFSEALNAALYDMLHITVMVTKDAGAAGGVPEKILPALERNIHVILIDRPSA